MRPWGQTPDCHRRTSCVAAQNESARPRPQALDLRDANKTAGARVTARAEIFAFASHIAQAKPKDEVNAEVSCPQRK